MLQTKSKLIVEIPGSPSLVKSIKLKVIEPIRVPRPGRAWTIADLNALSDDENHYELVRGDLLMMTPGSPIHGRYATRLATALFNHVDERDLGEVYTAEPGFILHSGPEPVVRAPDIAFVRKERIPPTSEQEGFWSLAPDLIVEIVSPSESANCLQEKVNDYLVAGTQLIWLVYPATKTIVEYQASGFVKQLFAEELLVGGELIPGFSYPLKKLFR
jgi:Uma2 family endonuclease